MEKQRLYQCCLCYMSFLFISTGIILLTCWSFIYNAIVDTNFQLKPNNLAYQMWKKTPIQLNLDFYLHNWTNPYDIHNSSIKPRFEQVGPYRFIESREKSNIRWNDNDTVSFNILRHWQFSAESSNGSLDDTFVTIDPLPIAAAYTTRNWNRFARAGLSMTMKTMNKKDVHTARTVGQTLFDGYKDSLMTAAMNLPFLSISMPKMDKFGWFYTRNGSASYEGTFNMGTGAKSRSDFGRLYNWRYQNRTPFYEGECSNFQSSAGEFFPNNLNRDSIVSFFSSDLCRKVDLEYDSVRTVNNIVGLKYSAGDRFLDNGTRYPPNKCYCDGDCMPSGAVNVSACRFGAPAFVSLPNFYHADPSYTDSVEGLVPDKSKHDLYMIMEPTTGVPLEVAARLQLNLLLQPYPGITLFQNVPKVYFPVLWFEQVASLPYYMAFSLRLLINMRVICTAIGILFIIIGLFLKFCFYYKLCTMKLLCTRKENISVFMKERVPLTGQISR